MANSADPDQLASSEGRVYPGSAGQWLHFVVKLQIIGVSGHHFSYSWIKTYVVGIH